VFGKGLKGLLEQWIQGRGCPHLAVIGRTGAGKTTLVKKIILLLMSQGASVQVLDFDDEYSDLPLEPIMPPFKIPSEIKLSWLLSQINRPELGGYGISGVLALLEEDNNLDDIITKVKHDFAIPQTVKFAVLWRLQVLRKYFIISDSDDPESTNVHARFSLSSILDLRERQLVQQILASVHALKPGYPGYLVIEEGLPGDWLLDILVLARRRKRRVVFVSQILPEQIQNFELLLFTPYVFNSRMVQLPLPVNPALDKGLWWIGSLGIHRIKHVW
jgi:energy-coupling factor transporter ATP-binding protein EcfA2